MISISTHPYTPTILVTIDHFRGIIKQLSKIDGMAIFLLIINTILHCVSIPGTHLHLYILLDAKLAFYFSPQPKCHYLNEPLILMLAD